MPGGRESDRRERAPTDQSRLDSTYLVILGNVLNLSGPLRFHISRLRNSSIPSLSGLIFTQNTLERATGQHPFLSPITAITSYSVFLLLLWIPQLCSGQSSWFSAWHTVRHKCDPPPTGSFNSTSPRCLADGIAHQPQVTKSYRDD